MSARVEWMDARYTSVEVVPGGEFVGDFAVDKDKIGLAFGGDSAVVIEGTPERLTALLHAALRGVGHGAPQDDDKED